MKTLFLLSSLFLLSCASKDNLSEKYRFNGKLNVLVNGEDVSEDCTLILNDKQAFAWNMNKVSLKKDGALNFSSKNKDNYFNEIKCSPGVIASEIVYSFKEKDFRVNALELSELNIGELIFDWQTGSYAGGIVGGVAIDLVTGLNSSKSRSTEKFIVKHFSVKQKNTEVLISERLLKD